jgi:ABC-2 type transport system ATP-binding protein
MVQRLQIARGLLNDPEIIFMDEPTIGLDPVGANTLRELIRKIKAEGRTVFLTTHYMQEADELSDRIAILSHGKIAAAGTSNQLKEQYGPKGSESTLEEVFLALMQEE